MYKIYFTLIFGLIFTSIAMAIYSGAEHKADDSASGSKLPIGTAAWLITESTEQVIKTLIQNNTISEAGLTSAEVNLDTATKANIDVRTNIGPVSEVCEMFAHSSRRGTAVKKEVRCTMAPFESKIRLTRGSDAWAVVESIEHSLRLAAVSMPFVLTSTVGAESVLAVDKSVDVSVKIMGGKELRYRCLRQSFGQVDPNSLNCSLQQ